MNNINMQMRYPLYKIKKTYLSKCLYKGGLWPLREHRNQQVLVQTENINIKGTHTAIIDVFVLPTRAMFSPITHVSCRDAKTPWALQKVRGTHEMFCKQTRSQYERCSRKLNLSVIITRVVKELPAHSC